MKICALIPARGGSKRIPKKNVYEFNGKPLISYVIKSAQDSKYINEVWISTDDDIIKETSEEYGAKVITRPDCLCTDTSSSESALIHFIENVECDILVFIQATSPMLDYNFLNTGIEMIQKQGYDSILSVCKNNRFYWDKDGNPVNYNPLNRPRTQDKEPWFMETGSFYITKTKSLIESKCRISGKIGYVEVPEIYSFEIDTLDDLKLLSSIMKNKEYIM